MYSTMKLIVARDGKLFGKVRFTQSIGVNASVYTRHNLHRTSLI